MKKIFLVLTAAALISSAGCRSSNTQTVTSQISSEHGSSVSSVQKYENSTDTGPTDKTPHSTGKADETLSPGGNTVSADETQDSNEKTKSESARVPPKDNISLNTPKDPVSSTESDGKKSSVSSYNEADSNSSVSSYNEADSNDETWIENRVIELFNEYRNTPLKSLSGLSEYDKLRSVQLVTNFAHDIEDMRKASDKLKYGKLIITEESYYDFEKEEVVYTGETIKYYQVDAMEAIGRGGILMRTPEQIALEIASGFRNSAGHWSYLGSDEYKYIGCGVTVKDGNWYCCVSVAETNTDENP